MNWLTTSCESHQRTTRRASYLRASFSTAITASCSTSLLVISGHCMDWQMTSPVGTSSMSPSPDPDA